MANRAFGWGMFAVLALGAAAADLNAAQDSIVSSTAVNRKESTSQPRTDAQVEAASYDDFDAPAGSFNLPIGVPTLPGKFEFHGGVLFLQPSANNLGWGVTTYEKNFSSPHPIVQPYWTINTLDPSYQAGFEVGGSYNFCTPGADFRANWQHLSTSDADSAGVTQSTGEWISPFSQTGPPTASDYQDMYTLSGVNKLTWADAQVYFDYDVVNLDFGQHIDFCSPLNLRLFGGVSYARIQEQLVSSFHGGTPSSTAPYPQNVPILVSIDDTSSYWGIGPRFGVDTKYQVAKRLHLTGSFAGAVLIGEKTPSQYSLTGTSPELAALGIAVNREYIGSDSFTEVVTAWEGKLGVDFRQTFARCRTFSFETGYQAAIYLNPLSGYQTNENIIPLQSGSLSTGSMDQSESNFTVHGFYAKAGVTW